MPWDVGKIRRKPWGKSIKKEISWDLMGSNEHF
jgi:hypothetical protein